MLARQIATETQKNNRHCRNLAGSLPVSLFDVLHKINLSSRSSFGGLHRFVTNSYYSPFNVSRQNWSPAQTRSYLSITRFCCVYLAHRTLFRATRYILHT